MRTIKRNGVDCGYHTVKQPLKAVRIRVSTSDLLALLICCLMISPVFSQNVWSDRSTPGAQYLYNIEVPTETIIYTAGTSGILYKSTDKGLSWNTISMGTNHWAVGLDFIDAQEGWAAFINGSIGTSEIRHTTDGGLNWTPMLDNEGEEFGDIFFLDRLNGWTITRSNAYYHTTDGGLNWSRVTINTSGTLTGVQFVDQDRGWISTSTKQLFRTTDGGSTWTPYQFSDLDHFFLFECTGGVGHLFRNRRQNNGWRTKLDTHQCSL